MPLAEHSHISTRQREFYWNNDAYTTRLLGRQPDYFDKYVDVMVRLSKPGDLLLDVGCGPGLVLEMARRKAPDRTFYGLEVSMTSARVCQSNGLNCDLYDGLRIPYRDETFAVVGSFDVLEHTEDPSLFLQEQCRVLRPGGALIVACPNFLAISNSNHHHTRGWTQKTRNVASVLRRLLRPHGGFARMQTIKREQFESDDDACNVTNPLDVLGWARCHDLAVAYWSAHSRYRSGIVRYLDFPPLRPFLGVMFVVLIKKRHRAGHDRTAR